MSIPLLYGPALAEQVTDALRRCSEIVDRDERLDCFDDVMVERGRQDLRDRDARSSSLPESAPLDSSNTLADPSPEAAPDDHRGAAEEEFGREMLKGSAARDTGLRQIKAELIRIDRLPRGERIFELSNEQRWVELSPGRYPYRSGMQVSVRRSTFGAYVLSAPNGGATRVRRVE